MTTKPKQPRLTRAEEFLVSFAGSVTKPAPVRGTRDVEVAARGIADYFVRKVAAGDLDSILKALDRTLEQNAGSGRREAENRGARLSRPRLKNGAESRTVTGGDKVDPYYWG
jgi:hypothetical protein